MKEEDYNAIHAQTMIYRTNRTEKNMYSFFDIHTFDVHTATNFF